MYIYYYAEGSLKRQDISHGVSFFRKVFIHLRYVPRFIEGQTEGMAGIKGIKSTPDWQSATMEGIFSAHQPQSLTQPQS